MRVSEPDNVRAYDQHQMLLFPPSIRSTLPDDHLCIVVDDIVNTMDLSCLYIKVASEGNPPYHPAMMLKVLFYAYATGIFSSRKIAKAIRESIPFIYLGAWQQPDFRTISDFRKNNLRELCHCRFSDYSSQKKGIFLRINDTGVLDSHIILSMSFPSRH